MDASVAVKLFVMEPDADAALDLLRTAHRLLAPDFMPVEVANGLWKKFRRLEISPAQVDDSVATLFGLGIQWVGTHGLLRDAGHLAREIGHPIYDCLYLALARAHHVPLATFDRRVTLAARATHTPLLRLKGRA